jgi:hypothetical protein
MDGPMRLGDPERFDELMEAMRRDAHLSSGGADA